ncbi:MAG: hypothetical protein IJJ00_06760 [Erysipelotrichaceae bacterium]|nr:hypothetical protein [Erysipelotrichaceae bacterium]
MKISPSIYSSDLMHCAEELEFSDKYFDHLHIDIQDGVYSEVTLPMKLILEICEKTSARVSVHLQVTDPMIYLNDLLKVKHKIEVVHIHVEHLEKPLEVLKAYKDKGFRTGLGLSNRNLDKPIDEFLPYIDTALTLTAFIEDPDQLYSKTMEDYIIEVKKKKDIEMWADGGIRIEMLPHLEDIGIDYVVMGRAVYRNKDHIGELSPRYK